MKSTGVTGVSAEPVYGRAWSLHRSTVATRPMVLMLLFSCVTRLRSHQTSHGCSEPKGRARACITGRILPDLTVADPFYVLSIAAAVLTNVQLKVSMVHTE